ncbi:nitroreductase/quinone reductase family protein [Streptomyces sp. NPDC048243]|uniref:nitroreductase/quinone reductase family protein n=1 Tax=Streptomyces sp. NPDC048243 TaxID=3365522 RepID=UPI0037176AA4
MPGVRLVQRVSSTRAFAKVAPHLIPALDRAVHRLTRGKVLLSAQMLPGIVLTARGARSGLERRTPLACMPEAGAARVGDETGAGGAAATGRTGTAGGTGGTGGSVDTGGTPDTGRTPEAEGGAGAPESGWILVGSNFGRTGHPAWTANLLAHPDAVISWKGEDIPVTARLLTGEERAAVWRTALAFWPPYATYQARVDREIRLFRIVRRQATVTPDAVDGPPPA